MIACVAAVSLAIGGCTSKKASSTTNGGALPAAADLMSQAETAMTNVQTVHFTLDVKGQLAGLPVSKAEGDLTKAGDAKGTATVAQFGLNIEAKFVIVNKQYYFQGPTGGFQQLSQSDGAALFDPSSILDPDRGVVKLMQTARDPKTEAQESVNGSNAYRVSLTPDAAAVASLVPGATAGTTGKIWIDAASHKVVRGEFQVPGAQANQIATVTINLSNFDAPVTVSAPQ
jgi:lipoprotein LprG